MYTKIKHHLYALLKEKYISIQDHVEINIENRVVVIPVLYKGTKLTGADSLLRQEYPASKNVVYDLLNLPLLNTYISLINENGRVYNKIRMSIVERPNDKRRKYSKYDIQPNMEFLKKIPEGHTYSISFDAFNTPRTYTDSVLYTGEVLGPYIYKSLKEHGNSVLSVNSYNKFIESFGNEEDLIREISTVIGFKVTLRKCVGTESYVSYIIEKAQKDLVKF